MVELTTTGGRSMMEACMTDDINIGPTRGVKTPARRAGWRTIALGALAVAGMGLGVAPTSATAAVYLGTPVFVYPPPPVIYAPHPVYVVPAPVYVAPYVPPAQAYVPPPPILTTTCRPYQTNATVGGVPSRVTGTACRQPDGSWVAVN
jgi:hypothetical protein